MVALLVLRAWAYAVRAWLWGPRVWSRLLWEWHQCLEMWAGAVQLQSQVWSVDICGVAVSVGLGHAQGWERLWLLSWSCSTVASSWVGLRWAAPSLSLGFTSGHGCWLLQWQQIPVSSAEQATGDHGVSCHVTATNSLCLSSLFLAVSCHLKCANLTSDPFHVDSLFLLHYVSADTLMGLWILSGLFGLWIVVYICFFMWWHEDWYPLSAIFLVTSPLENYYFYAVLGIWDQIIVWEVIA